MQEIELNQNQIQLSGRAELDTPMKINTYYDLMIRVSCEEEKKKNLNDGKYNMIYSVKPIGTIAMVDEKGEISTAKVKGSKSQLLRIRISEVDNYDMCMDTMLNHPEELVEWTKLMRETYGK